MDAPLDAQGYLNVPMGKGCLLRLTPMEYANGIKRGKAFLRATQHAAREAQRQAEQEAERLAWIGDTKEKT